MSTSKNPKRHWSKIKSLLHSSPPAEQLSPSLSQPMANSLASFFCQKIVALKESISSKLHGGPSPFDFDQPHATELLSDFAPVTPAEVTRLLHSMSNKSSQLDYIPTSLLKSCADAFSLLISHLANLSCRPPGLRFSFFIIYFMFSTDIWPVISCVLLFIIIIIIIILPGNFSYQFQTCTPLTPFVKT